MPNLIQVCYIIVRNPSGKASPAIRSCYPWEDGAEDGHHKHTLLQQGNRHALLLTLYINRNFKQNMPRPTTNLSMLRHDFLSNSLVHVKIHIYLVNMETDRAQSIQFYSNHLFLTESNFISSLRAKAPNRQAESTNANQSTKHPHLWNKFQFIIT